MPEREMTALCELALKHKTDKGGWHTFAGDTCHNYTPIYHAVFGQRRHEVRRVLEVGVNHGSSLRMWQEYFPFAEIFGLDLRPECLFREERICCFQADQGNPDSLRVAVAQTGGRPFDLIVDDGSHIRQHQVVTANTLIHYLAQGGSFFTEDLAGPYAAEITCRPDLLAAEMIIPDWFAWRGWSAGDGIGRARCKPHCQSCKGQGGEYLLEIRRAEADR